MNGMNDLKLLKILKNDPECGFVLLIEQYAGLVKSVVVRLLGCNNSQDVEECVSDVFVRFYRSLDNFDPKSGSLKGYLCGIARYTALDYRRHLVREASWLSVEENEIGVEIDPSDKIAAETNRLILRKTVLDMESPDKEIFIMRYFFGEKVVVIADKLSMDSKSVENRLYRGKKRLKAKLLERGIIL
jgi:RNA polymerase sigma-70 factor (ECF subfamily)